MKTGIADNTYRIRRTSRLFIRLLKGLMVIVPLVLMAVWIFLNDLLPLVQHELLPVFVRLPLPPLSRLLAFCISLIPLALFCYANTTLIRLFRLYERGQIFSADNVGCFRRLSRALMAWCLVGILIDPFMGIALTLHHPPGERILYVGLGSPDLTALLIGGILAVISWVMDEARKLEEEQALTI